MSSARDVVLCGGKRYRPTLCFLSGYPHGNYNDLLSASIVIELVHVASLVHDDVLDNAQQRRGKLTIHKKIGINNAILLGDSLFSYALELSTEFQDNMICKIVSRATRKTCSGEIAQNSCIGNFGLTIKEYEQIISDKTGYLFGASCKLGGTLSGVDSFDQANLESIGISLGIVTKFSMTSLMLLVTKPALVSPWGRTFCRSNPLCLFFYCWNVVTRMII